MQVKKKVSESSFYADDSKLMIKEKKRAHTKKFEITEKREEGKKSFLTRKNNISKKYRHEREAAEIASDPTHKRPKQQQRRREKVIKITDHRVLVLLYHKKEKQQSLSSTKST